MVIRRRTAIASAVKRGVATLRNSMEYERHLKRIEKFRVQLEQPLKNKEKVVRFLREMFIMDVFNAYKKNRITEGESIDLTIKFDEMADCNTVLDQEEYERVSWFFKHGRIIIRNNEKVS